MANTLKFGAGQWATKEGSTLAYNDENDNYKPLPFTFTRASNATVVNKAGLIETVGNGIPRIDFLGNTQGALKLEPQRTNLITYSEDFSDASWVKDNATITSNSVISPDGTLNASTLIGSTVNSRHNISTSVGNASVDGSYTVFAKAKELRYLQITSANTTQQYVNFDLLNGVFVLGSDFSSAKMEDYGNGWYKCTVVSDNEYNGYYLSLVSGLNATWLESWVMPNNTDGLYIYGAQQEVGSYATSYIPTQGSAVTRLADSCEQTVPDGVIGQTEGTIYLDTVINTDINGLTRISLSEGASTSNWIFFSTPEVSGGNVRTRIYINNGGNLQLNLYGGFLTGGRHKIALAYKENDVVLYVDGVLDISSNSALIPSTDKISLTGSSPTSINADRFNKHSDFKLYNTRLSNAELQALTT